MSDSAELGGGQPGRGTVQDWFAGLSGQTCRDGDIRLVRRQNGTGLAFQAVVPHVLWGRCYVQPFIGDLGVLLAKPPHEVEVLSAIEDSWLSFLVDAKRRRLSRMLWRPSRVAWAPTLRAVGELPGVVSAYRFLIHRASYWGWRRFCDCQIWTQRPFCLASLLDAYDDEGTVLFVHPHGDSDLTDGDLERIRSWRGKYVILWPRSMKKRAAQDSIRLGRGACRARLEIGGTAYWRRGKSEPCTVALPARSRFCDGMAHRHTTAEPRSQTSENRIQCIVT